MKTLLKIMLAFSLGLFMVQPLAAKEKEKKLDPKMVELVREAANCYCEYAVGETTVKAWSKVLPKHYTGREIQEFIDMMKTPAWEKYKHVFLKLDAEFAQAREGVVMEEMKKKMKKSGSGRRGYHANS